MPGCLRDVDVQKQRTTFRKENANESKEARRRVADFIDAKENDKELTLEGYKDLIKDIRGQLETEGQGRPLTQEAIDFYKSLTKDPHVRTAMAQEDGYEVPGADD